MSQTVFRLALGRSTDPPYDVVGISPTEGPLAILGGTATGKTTAARSLFEEMARHSTGGGVIAIDGSVPPVQGYAKLAASLGGISESLEHTVAPDPTPPDSPTALTLTGYSHDPAADPFHHSPAAALLQELPVHSHTPHLILDPVDALLGYDEVSCSALVDLARTARTENRLLALVFDDLCGQFSHCPQIIETLIRLCTYKLMMGPLTPRPNWHDHVRAPEFTEEFAERHAAEHLARGEAVLAAPDGCTTRLRISPDSLAASEIAAPRW